MDIRIADIRRDGGTQLREGPSEDTISAYAEAMRAGATFPPVVVFKDGAGVCWLADGFQRIEARSRIGHGDINADVRTGTVRDAILYAVGANDEHGLRRTNADKRRAVMKLLEDAEWSGWSNVVIAEKCRVGHTLVNTLRSSLDAKSSDPTTPKPAAERTYKTKHGTTAKMRTEKIGTRKERERFAHFEEAVHKQRSFAQAALHQMRVLWHDVSERGGKDELVTYMKQLISEYENPRSK